MKKIKAIIDMDIVEGLDSIKNFDPSAKKAPEKKEEKLDAEISEKAGKAGPVPAGGRCGGMRVLLLQEERAFPQHE